MLQFNLSNFVGLICGTTLNKTLILKQIDMYMLLKIFSTQNFSCLFVKLKPVTIKYFKLTSKT